MMQEPFSCDGLATAICSADGRQVITWWSSTGLLATVKV